MKRNILIILILITLAFIWGHSMVPKPVSAQESGKFLKLLYPLLSLFLDPKYITDHLVRKMAHFTEYAVLGMEMRGLVGECRKEDRSFLFKSKMIFVPAVMYSFFTAFIDETIQIFSHRGSMISDVWLDTTGALCGVVIIHAIVAGMRRKHID